MFSRLPTDVMEDVLASLLDTPSLSTLSSVSHQSSFFAKPLLQKRKIEKLLQHVAYGQQKAAEAMLKEDPNLLLEKAIVEDYSFGKDEKNLRKIEGTAFQIALGAEDFDMCEMMLRYFDQLPYGKTLKLQQISEQFSENNGDKTEEERCFRDFEALDKVVKAIAEAKENDDCEAALDQFRAHLEPRGVIKKGKHFNTQLLLRALELYDEKYAAFGNRCDSPKNILFWRKIIGYIQRFLPAHYAQAFSQGLFSIIKKGEKLNRSLIFRYDNACFFPLNSNPQSRLGYDFAASPTCGREHLRGGGLGGARRFAKLLSSNSKKACKIFCVAKPIHRRASI